MVSDQADYVELDCSFRVSRPYASSVPLCIMANESFPIELAIATPEGGEIHQDFASVLAKSGFDQRQRQTFLFCVTQARRQSHMLQHPDWPSDPFGTCSGAGDRTHLSR
jgi:hypothetical protein